MFILNIPLKPPHSQTNRSEMSATRKSNAMYKSRGEEKVALLSLKLIMKLVWSCCVGSCLVHFDPILALASHSVSTACFFVSFKCE